MRKNKINPKVKPLPKAGTARRTAEKTTAALDGVRLPLLSINDAARCLNVSRATVYRLMEAGALKPVYVGSIVRFRPSDIDAVVRSA